MFAVHEELAGTFEGDAPVLENTSAVGNVEGLAHGLLITIFLVEASAPCKQRTSHSLREEFPTVELGSCRRGLPIELGETMTVAIGLWLHPLTPGGQSLMIP